MEKRPIKNRGIVEIPNELESDCKYARSIGVGNQIKPNEIVEFSHDFDLRQIVQGSSQNYEALLKTSAIMLGQPELFLQNPLSSILDPENAGTEREQTLRVFNRRFRFGSEKSDILNEVRDVVLGICTSDAITSDVCLAADELFTNGVYNAPHVKFESNGPGSPRTLGLGNNPGLRYGELFVGFDKHQLIIGCIDEYGTLNPRHLIKRLQECFIKGPEKAMNLGSGGAGLGTFLMFQAALSLFVGVDAHQKSVVCFAYSLERSARIRSNLPKSLHLCERNK